MIKEPVVRTQTDNRSGITRQPASPGKPSSGTTAKETDRNSQFARREASGQLKRSVTKLLSDEDSDSGRDRAKTKDATAGQREERRRSLRSEADKARTPSRRATDKAHEDHKKPNGKVDKQKQKQKQKQQENVARVKAEKARREADEKSRAAEAALAQAATQKMAADAEVSNAETLVNKARQQGEILKQRASGLTSQKAATYVTAARELQTQAAAKKSEADSLRLAAEGALMGAAAMKARADELRQAAEREQAALAALMQKNAEQPDQFPGQIEMPALPMITRTPIRSSLPRLNSSTSGTTSFRSSLTSLSSGSSSIRTGSETLAARAIGTSSSTYSSTLSSGSSTSELTINPSMSTDEILDKLEQRTSRSVSEVSRRELESPLRRNEPEDVMNLPELGEREEQTTSSAWKEDEDSQPLSGAEAREYESKAREKELQKERAEREKIRREGIRFRAQVNAIYAVGSDDRAERLRSGPGGPPVNSKLERDKRAGIEENFRRVQDSSLPAEWSGWNEDLRWERDQSRRRTS